MVQEMWNGPPGFRPFRPTKSAPSSPAKPLGISKIRSESFHIIPKVPVGDTPYVRAKNVQLVEKDPERAIPLFWAAINAGDRVDSALKDMAIVMKQQNRAEEAIEAIKSLRSRCSDQAQEALDNILLDLYKRCGRLSDQTTLLRHKLYLIQQGMAFNGRRTKTARSLGKKFQVSVEQEATRLLGNLGWALMQQNNYIEAEDAYRRALVIAPDNNKMCNLGICLMKQGRVKEAKDTLKRVKPAVTDGPRGVDSHLKAYERAQQMLRDLESVLLNNKGGTMLEQSRLFDAFLGSSAIWQPQPCKEQNTFTNTSSSKYADENMNSNIIANHIVSTKSMQPTVSSENLLNKCAPPFYTSKIVNEPTSTLLPENLKRTRSGNAAHPMRINMKESKGTVIEQENMARKQSNSKEKVEDRWAELLPDSKDFEQAIIAAALNSSDEILKPEEGGCKDSGILPRKIDKRLKVFQDITLSLSPRA
uniref:Protein POLLENLESS 3-LIKE 2-like n=1 Tax=Nicotiana tabacum TaxID=4097 RepID=A0A1S4CQY0_TOBAC|nr:PREDICTED: protein POLLENLESS 3-LIKE 2-like [Nicotiana tabacum]